MNFRDVTSAIEVTFEGDRKYLVETLDDAVALCARQAQRFAGKAKLTIALEFVPHGGGEMHIGGSVVAKLPCPKAFPAKAYVDKAGRLVADDPHQNNLFEPLAVAPAGGAS